MLSLLCMILLPLVEFFSLLLVICIFCKGPFLASSLCISYLSVVFFDQIAMVLTSALGYVKPTEPLSFFFHYVPLQAAAFSKLCLISGEIVLISCIILYLSQAILSHECVCH